MIALILLPAVLILPRSEWLAEPRGPFRSALVLPLATPRIVIVKSRRELTLYSSGRLIKTYRIALGLDPVADKVREGDRRTPEGIFYVCGKNPHPRFHLALSVSYPNLGHAARGLRAGLITRSEYGRIARAIRSRGRPPQKTKLGGDILIHGGGSVSDWTLGCIALDNPDMEELYRAVPRGARIEIRH